MKRATHIAEPSKNALSVKSVVRSRRTATARDAAQREPLGAAGSWKTYFTLNYEPVPATTARFQPDVVCNRHIRGSDRTSEGGGERFLTRHFPR